MKQLRVGVIGVGLISRTVHLPYLKQLVDQFTVAAVCDLSESRARWAANEFAVPVAVTDWRELLQQELDAVLVLTSGDHATIVKAAAAAGLHVLVEKPMCYSTREGEQMIAAARASGTTLMVGYPKRYDPAFTRFAEEVARIPAPRLVRVTTFESPAQPYLAHLPEPAFGEAGPPPPGSAVEDEDATIDAALGSASAADKRVYRNVLLDTLVHEINTLRGLFGEPRRVEWVDLRDEAVIAVLRFGDVPAVINWVDLPGITRFRMEFSVLGAGHRATLAFPSPYLHNAPATLELEGGEIGTARSWRTEEIVSFDSAFRRELLVFHDAVISGSDPPTSGTDGLRDIAICEALVTASTTGAPVDLAPDNTSDSTGRAQ